MTVKELYYATSLIGPICLSFGRKDIFGYDTADEKNYSSGNDLQFDLPYIGDYKITHIQSLRGYLHITIEEP